MAGEIGAAARIISHIQRYQGEPWNPEVLSRTKLCLLDSVACFSAGRALPHFKPSENVARKLFGTSPDHKELAPAVSPLCMAYLYAQAANALDFDDTLHGHPGGPIVGAVLAIAAQYRLSTDRILRGIAAGYDAHWLLFAAAIPSPAQSKLVRSVGVWDTVAAALGCGVALGLEPAALERVIGVAAAHSTISYTAKWYDRPVPDLKNNMGWIAAGAVMSTELAISGLSGVTAPLDGDTGMWRMVGSDQWALTDNLFEKAAVLRTGFKLFPACWHLQEYLKAFSALIASKPFDDEITEIVVKGPREIERFCETTISAPADVAFSLPATFSLVIAGIEPGPAWYSSEQLSLSHTFRFELSDRRAIDLFTRGGSRLVGEVDTTDAFGRGADLAAAGLDDDGVVEKHKRLTDPLLQSELMASLSEASLSDENGVPEGVYAALTRLVAA